MKKTLVFLTLLAPNLASADGFILGAGRWTCVEVVAAHESGDMSNVGQALGWLFGYWSAATLNREESFTDIVENAGGRAIYDATVAECRKAPENAMLYQVAQSMIDNTH